MGTARSIASILGTAIVRGPKLLVSVWWAMRQARGQVKEGAKTMYKTLMEEGIPDEEARQIAVSFAAPAWEMLQLRSIVKLVQDVS